MTRFENCIETLESFMHRRGIDYSLDNFRAFLETLGNPHVHMTNVIHVAGTNGKGSTVALLSAGLQALGFSVGTYTSPHLYSYTERLKINDTPITEDAFATLFEPLLEKTDRVATEFELLTAGAFMWFKQERPDFIIIETGLGGRLDATNVVSPLCSVITKIGVDHAAILGNTISEIAFEKAGIIKSHTPVVTINTQDEDALTVIRNTAIKTTSKLYEAEPLPELPKDFPLQGTFQYENVAIALATLNCVFPSQELSLSVFKNASHPGRFQLTEHKGTPVVLDGAHNPHAISALLDSLTLHFPDRPWVFVMASLQTKDVAQMIEQVKPHAHALYWVDFWPGMSVPKSALKHPDIAIELSSIRDIFDHTLPDNAVVVVTGSMHFLGTYSL
jgi:dihydrofolate synthase/folylpolyglutamate synthase